MIKKIGVIGLLGASLLVFSCNSGSNSEEAAAADSTSAGAVQRNKERLENSSAVSKTDNLTSALKFAETNENTTVWGILLRMSKYSKDIHKGQYTVLVPTNDVLRAMDLNIVAELKYTENKEILDRVMGKHIIKERLFVEKMDVYTEVETIDGQKLPVEWGQNLIGRAKYSMTQVETQNGSVIFMNEVIDFPKEILIKSAKRRGTYKDPA